MPNLLVRDTLTEISHLLLPIYMEHENMIFAYILRMFGLKYVYK